MTSDDQLARGDGDAGTIHLSCSCGWSFNADTESLAHKQKTSHRDLCNGEWKDD